MIHKIYFFMLVIFCALAFTLTSFTSWAQLTPFGKQNEDIVQLKPFLSVDKVQPGSQFQIAVVVQLKEGWHIQAHKPSENFIPTELWFDPISGFEFGDVVYPEPMVVNLAFADEPLKIYEGKAIFDLNVSTARDLKLGKQIILGRLKYQACTDVTCNLPAEKSFEVPVAIVGLDQPMRPINTDLFAQLKATTPSTPTKTTDTPEVSGKTSFDRLGLGEAGTSGGSGGSGSLSNRLVSSFSDAVQHNLLKAFIIVFFAGILTSLTPCIYPMIPITIGVIGSHATESKVKGFITSLVYVLGIALVYSIFGVIAASTGAAFGSLGQNIYIVGAVSLIFFVMGLSMFDLFTIQVPTNLASKLQSKKMGGLVGVFLMGGVTGIVASPCVGPVLVGVLAFVAQTGSIALGFSLLFTFALGIGVLFLILGTSASVALPRAGTWMESVKRFLGSALILTPLFLLSPFLSQTVNHWLRALVLVPLGGFLGAFNPLTHESRGIEKLAKAFGILLVAVGLLSLAPIFLPNGTLTAGTAQAPQPGLNWITDLESGLAQAKSEGRPAMVDFYADWCIACKELDKVTYSESTVQKGLKDFVAIKVDATDSASEKIKAIQGRYQVLGLPTVIFLNPNGEEILRFTEFRNPQQFLKTLDEVRSKI